MENSIASHGEPKFPQMKAFLFVQKNLAAAGINRTLATQAYPLNGRLLIHFGTLIATLVCGSLYAIYEAKSFFEFTQATYMISLVILVFVNLLIFALKANTLFELIGNADDLLNTSGYLNWIAQFSHLFNHNND